MTEPREEHTEAFKKERWYRRIALVLFVLTVLFSIALVFFNRFFYRGPMGPKQPIPFSHRLHAGKKEISCVVCHTGVMQSTNAGIPPLQTCMLCHEHIIITYPYIEDLREHYTARKPVEWVKVVQLPEYVQFTHKVHFISGIDCGQCHGDVKDMDRVKEVHKMGMGFCLDCHRSVGATHDCFICHH